MHGPSITESVQGAARDLFAGLRMGLSPPRGGFATQPRSRGIGETSIRHNGRVYRRYRAGYSPDDRKYQKETGDPKAFLCECGADFGQYHGLGCDLEDCPICKGQLLSCGHMSLFR